jgi:hypothetical protein
MPLIPLSENVLQSHIKALSTPGKSVIEIFSSLRFLYDAFEMNEELLSRFEYSAGLIAMERDYALKKEHWNNEHNQLKTQFKQLDNRIISAEQKLSRGIPEDLAVMDKLIAEQESIVSDQEKLNAAEAELIEHVRSIDIEHGKALQKFEQLKDNRTLPLKSRFTAYRDQINAAEKSISFKQGLLAVLPIVGIPIIIDFLAGLIGISSFGKTAHHPVLNHVIFFIALISMEIFLADKIRYRIAHFLAFKYADQSIKNLAELFRENQKAISLLENKHQIKVAEVFKTME